jgi:hypothetical protein
MTVVIEVKHEKARFINFFPGVLAVVVATPDNTHAVISTRGDVIGWPPQAQLGNGKSRLGREIARETDSWLRTACRQR